MKRLILFSILTLLCGRTLAQSCDGRPCQLWDGDLIKCTVVGDEVGRLKCWESEIKTVAMDAGMLVGDGTVCGNPSIQDITSTKKGWAVTCTTSAGGELVFKITNMPNRWDGGAVSLELDGVMFSGASATAAWDVSCACGAQTAFGASKPLSLSFSSVDTTVVGKTADPVTPAGTCGGGQDLWCKFSLDAPNSSNVENVYIIGTSLLYTAVSESD